MEMAHFVCTALSEEGTGDREEEGEQYSVVKKGHSESGAETSSGGITHNYLGQLSFHSRCN